MICRRAAHRLGVSNSPGAGARVGVTAVDDHRLDESPPHPPHPDEHGRGLDPVGGEKRRGRGRPFRKDQGEILFPALLDAAGNAGEFETGYSDVSHRCGNKNRGSRIEDGGSRSSIFYLQFSAASFPAASLVFLPATAGTRIIPSHLAPLPFDRSDPRRFPSISPVTQNHLLRATLNLHLL